MSNSPFWRIWGEWPLLNQDPLLHSRVKKERTRSEWLMKDFKSTSDNMHCMEMTNLLHNKEHPENCDSNSTKETLEVEITPLGE
jgi:hypothetical protein